MIKVSVVIPFFQRQPGVLRRALESILKQPLALGIAVHVIVVDDGSPVSAKSDAEGLDFKPPFHLTIVPQPNGGVAAARNTGLKSIETDTKYIAFLDSDDSWHVGHLNQAVTALEQGADFYFCDNARDDHHTSHFAARKALILPFIQKAAAGETIIALTREEAAYLVLMDFPTQASTTIYRRAPASDLFFDTSLKRAGEDVVFFLKLVSRMEKICFSPKIMVDCGTGINLYFSSLNWNSPGHLATVIDDLQAHLIIKKTANLARDTAAWNNAYISMLRRKVAFHILRLFVKSKGKWPAEAKALAREDKWFYVWFPFCALQVAIGKPLGLYHPT